MIGGLTTWLGAIGGAAAAIAVAWTYNVVIDNPSVVKETENVMMIKTYKAIGEIRNEADKARAMRRYCVESGKLYNFAENRCGQDRVDTERP